MKELWNWFLSLFKSDPVKEKTPSNQSETSNDSILIEPVKPIPEIPTKEEVDSFPKKEIADFRFVDSSHHHPDFNVKAYKYECDLFINKCTQGATMVDSTYKYRQELCKENNIHYGGYHFYSCSTNWKIQLEHYLKTHGEFVINPIVDYELSGGNSMEQLKANLPNLLAFGRGLKNSTGKLPVLYIGYSLAKELNLSQDFKIFIPWFPRYAPALGIIPKPWDDRDVMAWQFTEDGLFPGFKGGNDVNVYYGKNNRLNLG